MSGPLRRQIRSTTLLGVVVAALAACAPGAATAPSVSVVPATSRPTTSTPAAAASAAIAATSAQPSASAGVPDPIAEGSYTTGPLTAEMMTAAVTAHGLKAADAEAFIKDEGFKIHEVATVTLADGMLTLRQSLDGGSPTVGWKGSYAFVDSTTMVAADDYPITYGLAWDGKLLRLTVVKDTNPDAYDLVAQVALYESAPLTQLP